MNQQTISDKDALLLMIGFVMGTAIMLIPPVVVVEARQDAWLSLLISYFPSFFLIKILISLQKTFPGQSLVQYSVSVLGLPAGKVVSGIFIWSALHLSGLVLRNAGDFLESLILPHTPMVVLHAIVIMIAAYAVRGGLEVLTRTTVFVLPAMFFFYLLLSLLVLPKGDINRLTPLLENGFLPLVTGAIKTTSFPFGETALFAMFLFQLKDHKKTEKFLISGITIGFLIIDFGIIRSITVLGVESSMRYAFPVFEAIREAPASFILEIFLTLNWFVFFFVKLMICYYAFVSGVSQWLGLQDYRTIVTPAGVIIVALSILVFANYSEELYFAAKTGPYYFIPIYYGIPILLWLVAKAKIKKPPN